MRDADSDFPIGVMISCVWFLDQPGSAKGVEVILVCNLSFVGIIPNAADLV
jgi:hypothetical protein